MRRAAPRARRSAASGRDSEDGLAFVGDVKRVDAEKLPGGAHGVVDRDARLFEEDADAALLRHLVERGGETAARRVLHGDDRLDRPRRAPRGSGR